MPSITIQIELTDQFIYDILTNWVEGGYCDWALFSEINREVDTYEVLSTVVEDAGWHDIHGRHECTDCVDEPEFKHQDVGYDEVVRGLERVLSQDTDEEHVGISSTILDYIHRGVREQDAGDIDAIAADCIVQAGVFGKLVFA